MVMAAAGAAASFVGDALGFMKPTKAKLVCKDDNLPDGYAPLKVMFNPTEYTLKTAAKVTRTDSPATPGGTAQFAGTDAITLSLTLFLDAYSEPDGDVTPRVSTLLGWTYPTRATAGEGPTAHPMPPQVGVSTGATRNSRPSSATSPTSRSSTRCSAWTARPCGRRSS